MDDRYYAAFENYPETEKLVVVGWGTTGEVAANRSSCWWPRLAISSRGMLIPNNEPPARRLAALLARLRKVSPTPWLLVHDADWVEGRIEQGFRVVAPPDEPADDALLVLVWGELPEDVYALLRTRGLEWSHARHR